MRGRTLAGMPTRTRPTLLRADELAAAAAVLRSGGLLAFPTETVYGLGADAFDERAVRRVFAAKGRPPDNPLIVHVAGADWLPRVAARVTPLAADLARRFWPGPLTLVLDAVADLPAVTTGGHPTVGVRVPDHPLAIALLAEAGVPVAAPSANPSGRPSPTTAEHVLAELGDRVDAVLDGGSCAVGVESTVVDARGAEPVVLREGAVTREDLAASEGAGAAASPGTRYRHYAPACQVVVVDPADAAERATKALREDLRIGALAESGIALPAEVTEVGRFDGAGSLARLLYQGFREAEAADLDILLVTAVPERGLGRAVMDRLRRAAS